MALTQKCSYSCTFCYAGLQQNPAEAVSREVYDQFLEDCAEIGVKAISLVSDGESTENPHYVDFIVKAKSLGLDIALGTNGLKIRAFGALLDSLTYLRINFNAANPVRCAKIMGTSVSNVETVLSNIRALVALKAVNGYECTIGLQQVLLPEYADEVIPLALLARKLGVDYLVIKHCSDDEAGRLGVRYDWYRSEIAKRLFDAAESLSTPQTSIQVKRRKMQTGNNRAYSKCFGPPLMLQLSGSGIVAPCGSFFNPQYSRFHIGDLKTQRFKDIWGSDRYKQVMGHLGSDFDPRKACAALCLQDSVNLALFNLVEGGIDLPPAIDSIHDRNFL
jgi:MoaA/NifB/PqqE/SkfB family radical SAM enzyme